MLYLVLMLLAISTLAGALVVYVARLRPTPSRGPLLLLLAAVAVWSTGYALELWSADLGTKLFWDKVQYVGVVAVAPVWFVFVLTYTGGRRRITRRQGLLLALVPFITLVLAWTNGLHGLMWARQDLSTTDPFSLLDVTYALGFGSMQDMPICCWPEVSFMSHRFSPRQPASFVPRPSPSCWASCQCGWSTHSIWRAPAPSCPTWISRRWRLA